MAFSMVTSGYWWTFVLVSALFLAIKNNVVLPIPLDDKAETNPVVTTNIERLLATAMGLGLFIVSMIAYAEIMQP